MPKLGYRFVAEVRVFGAEQAESAEAVARNDEEETRHSPDGQKIAFGSFRTGGGEIWVSDRNGENPIPVTSLGRVSGTPRWSPDGKQIAGFISVPGVVAVGKSGRCLPQADGPCK